ncbi:hypothetical protein [Rhabdothermincola salaria]|uniref:hypothetical protein n=1 Tax=Rhabdothermincola salaria TaxID=2903142 RepID=UPI001E31F283|nr:hypothetical protein [Rhabdothermincola salaria]MCD9622792.1 hypothetical protein [Rhabdothermincola salaria]
MTMADEPVLSSVDLERALGQFLDRLEAGTLSAGDATVLGKRLGRIKTMAELGQAVCFRRAAAVSARPRRGDEDGSKWVARQMGTTRARAAELLTLVDGLEQAPATREKLGAGQISTDQAVEIVRTTQVAPEAEQDMLTMAGAESVGELRRRGNRIRAAAPGAEDRVARAQRNRYFRHGVDGEEGWGQWRMPLAPHSEFVAQIESGKDAIFRNARRQGRREKPEAYGADALVLLANDAAAARRAGLGGGAGPTDDAPSDEGRLESPLASGSSSAGPPLASGSSSPLSPRPTVGGSAGPVGPPTGVASEPTDVALPGFGSDPGLHSSDDDDEGHHGADDDGEGTDGGGTGGPGGPSGGGAAGAGGSGRSPGGGAGGSGRAGGSDRSSDDGGTSPGSVRSCDGGGGGGAGGPVGSFGGGDFAGGRGGPGVARRGGFPTGAEGDVDDGSRERGTVPSGAGGPSQAGGPSDDGDPPQARAVRAKVGESTVRVSATALLRGRTLDAEVCEVVGVGPVPIGEVRRWMDGGAFVAVVVSGDDPLDVHLAARLGRHPRCFPDGRDGGGRPEGGGPRGQGDRSRQPGASGPHAHVTVVVHATERWLRRAGPPELRAAVAAKGVDLRELVHRGRRPNAVQQTALAWMAPECCVLGCPNQARLEADHIREWRLTRHTVLDELEHLCTLHHRLKTHDGYRLAPGRGKRPLLPP